MKSSLATSVLLLIIAAGIFVAALFADNKQEDAQQANSEAIQNIKETLTPYQAKDSYYKEVVIQDFQNSAKNLQPDNSFSKNIAVTGTIVDGYLYVKASVNNAALGDYDGIYLKFAQTIDGKYSEFGGHLVKSQSLEAPQSATSTELLYDLASVRYTKQPGGSPIEAISGNWLEAINKSGFATIIGFSSTNRRGLIGELTLYYKCLAQTECEIAVTN